MGVDDLADGARVQERTSLSVMASTIPSRPLTDFNIISWGGLGPGVGGVGYWQVSFSPGEC